MDYSLVEQALHKMLSQYSLYLDFYFVLMPEKPLLDLIWT